MNSSLEQWTELFAKWRRTPDGKATISDELFARVTDRSATEAARWEAVNIGWELIQFTMKTGENDWGDQ